MTGFLGGGQEEKEEEEAEEEEEEERIFLIRHSFADQTNISTLRLFFFALSSAHVYLYVH